MNDVDLAVRKLYFERAILSVTSSRVHTCKTKLQNFLQHSVTIEERLQNSLCHLCFM